MEQSALPRSTGGEPVKVAARVTQVLTTAAPLVVLVLGMTGLATAEEATGALDATVTAVGAVGTVIGLVVPIVQARKVREVVVPARAVVAYKVADPRAAGGLVVAGPASSTTSGQPVQVRRADDVGEVDPL